MNCWILTVLRDGKLVHSFSGTIASIIINGLNATRNHCDGHRVRVLVEAVGVRLVGWAHLIQDGQGVLEHLQELLTVGVVARALWWTELAELPAVLLLLREASSEPGAGVALLIGCGHRHRSGRTYGLVQERVRLATLLPCVNRSVLLTYRLEGMLLRAIEWLLSLLVAGVGILIRPELRRLEGVKAC